jgi:hypothetical protein
MLAVADTSPINDLVLLDHAALLPALHTRVFPPPAVLVELRDPEAPEAVRAWAANLPAWRGVRRSAPLVGPSPWPTLGQGSRRPLC